MNNRVKLISQSEYARRRDVAKSAVSKAVAEGRISLIDGKIDPAVADIQWAQNTRARADSRGKAADQVQVEGVATVGASGVSVAPDSGAAGASAPAGDQGYADNRARREKYDADKAQMEAERMGGSLIQRAPTERAIFDSFRALRDSVMAVPKRAAAKVIQMPDARDIEQVLIDELRKAFEGWEERMLDKLPKADGA